MGQGRSDSDEPNEGGIGQGRRADGQPHGTRSFDSRAKTEFDPKGQKIFEGFAPGQNYKKKTGAEVAGEIERASQEAPEAIEQQRIPRPYQNSAKGYFRNLAGQGEKEKK